MELTEWATLSLRVCQAIRSCIWLCGLVTSGTQAYWKARFLNMPCKTKIIIKNSMLHATDKNHGSLCYWSGPQVMSATSPRRAKLEPSVRGGSELISREAQGVVRAVQCASEPASQRHARAQTDNSSDTSLWMNSHDLMDR